MNPLATIREPVHQSGVPHPALSPFISHYSFQDMYIPESKYVEKSVTFCPATAMDFFIGDPFKNSRKNKGKLVLKTRCIIRTPRAFKRCTPAFSGRFTVFSIQFHPAGLHNLLGINMDMFGNNAIPGTELKIFPAKDLTNRMLYATDISHCIKIIEPHLLSVIGKHRTMRHLIEEAARKIISKKGQVSIDEVAAVSCLSLSQLERKFTTEIGASPKDYACMHRIYQLVIDKIGKPDTKWCALAYDYGFCDPIHFSREFRKYYNFNPSSFAPSDYILM